MSTYKELISGKIYQCFDDGIDPRPLSWFRTKDNKASENLKNSTFIFLGFTNNNEFGCYKTITIKGLVDGKLLYAVNCSLSFRYEEIK